MKRHLPAAVAQALGPAVALALWLAAPAARADEPQEPIPDPEAELEERTTRRVSTGEPDKLPGGGTAAQPALATASLGERCVDAEIEDRMSLKRSRRGRVPRDFVKQQRHEVTAHGGYFVSDLFSATYVVGGSYAYHMTESTAVEAAFAFTHNDADVVRAVEDGRAVTIRDLYAPVYFVTSQVVWYPLHGKLQLGGSVVHFDLHLDLGAGVVAGNTSRGLTGVAGLGIKLYLGEAVAWRIDVRDHVYRQELLDEAFIVNDLSVTTGLSLFLPLGF